MIKLSDYVVDFLVARGIQDLFLVSGGGIMHLLDSVGRNPGMRYYCNYHEQACAISAEGFARASNGIGACLVTVGPGAVNALSGVVGAWYDGIPLLVISGQVRKDLIADYSLLRQRGPQEGNVIAMATPVTKYARTVLDPNSIREHLETALDAATTGRPGPVWLEIPLDVQSAMIDADSLPAARRQAAPAETDLLRMAAETLAILRGRRRPVLVAGNGVHLGRAERPFRRAVEVLGIPAVFPESGKDLLPEDHPLNFGIIGTAGQRRANFTVQNADCILAIGAGLSVKKVGFNYAGFAPHAFKIIVDVDRGQLENQAVHPDFPVHADVGSFLAELSHLAAENTLQVDARWLEACRLWKMRYSPVGSDTPDEADHVNAYLFMDVLSRALDGTEVIVTGNGLDSVSFIQAFRIQERQRAIINCNWGSMGWDLPLAIGACLGSGGRRTICVTGDGSIQWNIQELQTIAHYRLPVKIVLFNNSGYTSIRTTQNTFFDGRHVGSDRSSGVSNPDFKLLAAAYGLDSARIDSNEEIPSGLRGFLSNDRAGLCELKIAANQQIAPKASAFRREDGSFESRPLEDMAPFLPREEIWDNMHLFDEDP